jgi:hypothetical protein
MSLFDANLIADPLGVAASLSPSSGVSNVGTQPLTPGSSSTLAFVSDISRSGMKGPALASHFPGI